MSSPTKGHLWGHIVGFPDFVDSQHTQRYSQRGSSDEPFGYQYCSLLYSWCMLKNVFLQPEQTIAIEVFEQI